MNEYLNQYPRTKKILTYVICLGILLGLVIDVINDVEFSLNNALLLFALIIAAFLFRKGFIYGLFATGIILILVTFNVLSIFSFIGVTSFYIKISEMKIGTPDVNIPSAVLLALFIIVNFQIIKSALRLAQKQIKI